jgi:valyl-tRNA synthetase
VLLVSSTPQVVPLGHCHRCRSPVEQRLSRQGFVKIDPLA